MIPTAIYLTSLSLASSFLSFMHPLYRAFAGSSGSLSLSLLSLLELFTRETGFDFARRRGFDRRKNERDKELSLGAFLSPAAGGELRCTQKSLSAQRGRSAASRERERINNAARIHFSLFFFLAEIFLPLDELQGCAVC